ncbi:MAG: toxin-antitoxin system HicB family antitoxin [Actinomycetota bacterium]
MRQLIARIDDLLHERLKRVAKREGRSVNSLVVESLERAVEERDRPETPQEWKRRMIAEGRVVVPPQPEHTPDRETLLDRSRGWGPIVSDQLERDRDRQ